MNVKIIKGNRNEAILVTEDNEPVKNFFIRSWERKHGQVVGEFVCQWAGLTLPKQGNNWGQDD